MNLTHSCVVIRNSFRYQILVFRFIKLAFLATLVKQVIVKIHRFKRLKWDIILKSLTYFSIIHIASIYPYHFPLCLFQVILFVFKRRPIVIGRSIFPPKLIFDFVLTNHLTQNKTLLVIYTANPFSKL